MKRLAIFVFYDKDGVVDEYVLYLLQELKKCITDLIIVANGKVMPNGREQLEHYADWLYIRENKGYDAMAYKLAMTEYLGWDKLMQYDEVLLTNDTYYGPIYPFEHVFNEMQNRKVDFWGLTCQCESSDYYSCHQKKNPAYIQSFFCVFRRSVLADKKFQFYWEQFDSSEWIFSDVLNQHEKLFTKKLEDMGFHWETYIKDPVFESERPEQNFVQYYYIAYQLLKDHKCPIIKRKSFVIKHLTESHGSTGEDISRAFQYIQENTAYETDLIWDNLLRLYDIGDIQRTLNLNYILEGKKRGAHKDKGINAAAVIWLSSECCLKECMDYLVRMCDIMDIYLLTDSCAILQSVQKQISSPKLSVQLVSETQKMYKLLLGKAFEIIEKYTYFVFLHDIDYQNSKASKLLDYSEYRNIWSNLVENQSYILEVCLLFEQNPRLGMLAAPNLFMGTAFGKLGNQWKGKLQDVRHILADMQITTKIQDNAACINTCHSFWCRSKIFKRYINAILNAGKEYDTEAAARCYPYLAQAGGYYTGTVMNNGFASVLYTSMQELLVSILNHTRTKYNFTDFDSYLDGDVLLYCNNYKHIMVYGAGENGYRVACLLKKHNISFAGYIVSDGQPNDGEKYGDPLIAVSQLKKTEGLGIVVSVANPRFQAEIKENLCSRGYEDIYIL